MDNKCVRRHLYRINNGFDFHDIKKLRKKITAATGVESPGSELIHRFLGFSEASVQRTEVSLESLTFLFMDEEMGGNLSILEKAFNLQALHFNRGSEKGKIESLGPLGQLRSLRSLELTDQHITHLSPLSNNLELEEVNLQGNKIVSLKPLSQHRYLRLASFSRIEEHEIFLLLQSSQQAIFSYVNQERQYAFRVGKYMFKGSFDPSGDRIKISIEPINEQKERLTQVPPQMLRTLLNRCQEIGRIVADQELGAGDFNLNYDRAIRKITGHLKFDSIAYT